MLQNQYIHDPTEYLNIMQNHKKVLVMTQILSEFQLFDISLHRKGPFEDRLYLKDEYLLLNVKRGNSILQSPEGILQFCRRGMRKFYDLEHLYVLHNLNQQKLIKKYDQRVFKNIYTPIKDALSANKGVNLYKLYKENGEHLQISFAFDKWIIASKNCTIFVANCGDINLDCYQPVRYTWAKRIAEEWFKQISGESIKEIESLKQFLRQHTLVGEYCGNVYQHIIEYKEIQLKFYAIVENNSPSICLQVEKSKEIIEKHNLSFVKMESVKDLKNYEDVSTQLSNWLQIIESSSMEIEGEGSVCYIETENEVISVCKLKNIEYWIYRDMRETFKLFATSLFLNESVNIQNYLEKFSKKLQYRSAISNQSQNINYYISLTKLGLQNIYDKKIPFDALRYQFIDFMKDMKIQLQNNEQILEKQIIDLQFKKKHTRILLLTLPLLVNDQQLLQLEKQIDIKQIDCQYMCRNQKVTAQRCMSILHLIPKLPYNINNSQQLNEYLKHSPSEDQDIANIVFIFYGFNKDNQNLVMDNLKNQLYQKQNPITSSFAVQFTTAKPKIVQATLERWIEKGQQFYTDCLLNFADRVFQLNTLDFKIINEIYEQFEKTTIIQDISKTDEDDSDEHPEKNSQGLLIIIYPLLIPGCGKSTLMEYMKEHYKDYPFHTISGDEITHQLIKSKLGNSEESLQNKFMKVMKDIKPTFNQELHRKIEYIYNLAQPTSVLFMDRNCVPNTLQSTIEHIKAIKTDIQLKSGKQMRIKNLGLVFPEQEPNLGKSPFRLDFLLTIMNRLLERNDHILLGNEIMYKTLVSFKNICLFNGFKLKQTHFNKFNLDEIVHLNPLQDQFKLDKDDYNNTLRIAQQCVENSSLTRELGQGAEYNEFLQQMYYLKDKYPLTNIDITLECEKNCRKLSQAIQKIQSQ